MKAFILFAALFLGMANAKSGVDVESGCYVKTPEVAGKSSPFFLLRSYSDGDLQERVGALLSYNNSGEFMSLVFFDEIQGDGGASGDHQRIWLEVAGKKISGQYVEYGTYSGNAGGNQIKYTNFKTNKVTVFRVATIDSPCKVTR